MVIWGNKQKQCIKVLMWLNLFKWSKMSFKGIQRKSLNWKKGCKLPKFILCLHTHTQLILYFLRISDHRWCTCLKRDSWALPHCSTESKSRGRDWEFAFLTSSSSYWYPPKSEPLNRKFKIASNTINKNLKARQLFSLSPWRKKHQLQQYHPWEPVKTV